jgi:hypothetical protein
LPLQQGALIVRRDAVVGLLRLVEGQFSRSTAVLLEVKSARLFEVDLGDLLAQQHWRAAHPAQRIISGLSRS